jgi:L-asparaginase / beta-aspartyl-peptidase
VIGLGGAGSDVALSAAVLEAVRTSVKELSQNRAPLDAAVEGVVPLENNPELNAGMGSSIRFDGSSVQMDAAVMDSEGRLGIVASIARVKNPIRFARALADTPHPILVGGGAVGFARTKGYAPFNPATPRARAQRELALLKLGSAQDAGVADAAALDATTGADQPDAADAGPKREAGTSAFDGDPEPPAGVAMVIRTPEGVFVVAASDGGRPASLPGQVGAVSIPGAAVFAGPKGAVAATGPDHLLIQEMLARVVYERMVQTASPRQAVAWGLKQLPDNVRVGMVAMNARASHVDARGPMAWASWTSAGETVAEPSPAESKP